MSKEWTMTLSTINKKFAIISINMLAYFDNIKYIIIKFVILYYGAFCREKVE